MTFWVAGAVVVGGVANAAISSNAASKAAGQQQAASQSALGEEQREFDQNQANEQPYLDAGKTALGQYQAAINTPTTSADVMANDPGYQFELQQGQTALDRKIAAMGGRVSGAALKATDQYATNYATTGYNAAYQRSQDRLNRLASLAGLGQTATGASSAAGQAGTNAMSQLITNQGDASAASTLAQSNIWGNAGNQITAALGRYGASSGSNSTTGLNAGNSYSGVNGGTYANWDYGGTTASVGD